MNLTTLSTLCIPRIEKTFQRDYIINTLLKLKLGTIEGVTEIPLKNEPAYKRILVKIKWNDGPGTEKIKTRLMKQESIQIVYDGKWYWKLLLAKGS
uniref:Uncharacterized protein n=1 Tax=viral metagenome TaxID=1070528 RepID=A0A6C0DS98_9ZZZZ